MTRYDDTHDDCIPGVGCLVGNQRDCPAGVLRLPFAAWQPQARPPRRIDWWYVASLLVLGVSALLSCIVGWLVLSYVFTIETGG
jgi:hypothetical protein